MSIEWYHLVCKGEGISRMIDEMNRFVSQWTTKAWREVAPCGANCGGW